MEITVPYDDYLILFMSDSYVDSTNNLDRFLTVTRTGNVNADLMAEDLTTGHIKNYVVCQQHSDAPDSAPTFLSVGNHDLYFDG